MSILTTNVLVSEKNGVRFPQSEISEYQPSQQVKDALQLVLDSFQIGWTNMQAPFREFNDMSVIQRMNVDQRGWNTYQPWDGNAAPGDEMYAWKSNAIRPIVRNKAVSIAAHATARLLFPKIFARDEDSNEDRAAASVMEDLMEWSCERSEYPMTFMKAVIASLVDPCAIIHSEYGDVYRTINDGKGNLSWELDEEASGFIDTVVPCNELYIQDPFTEDIQKQGFLVWRKVISYNVAATKYQETYPDFQYVTPGKHNLLWGDDQTFYVQQDNYLSDDQVEEVIYWNKAKDLYLIMVNGVLMNDPFTPNPRKDKQYPFSKFGYEMIGNNFFYYKSVVFKMAPDARIINSLYPMIVDGTYLSIFPPMVAIGGEDIGSDVIIPGAVTTLADADSDLKPIQVTGNLLQGMNTLLDVEKSLDQSSQDPILSGTPDGGTQTAFEVAKLQQNSATVMGLFVKMIGSGVKQFGKLRVSDILQYLTVAEVRKITKGHPEIAYRTFFLPERDSGGRLKSRKITFDIGMPDKPITEDEKLEMSIDLLKLEGGPESSKEIWKVNPPLFRNMKYMVQIVPDAMNPMSEELERAFKLEEYDRAIMNPLLDQEQVTRDFLLRAYSESRKNPDKYFKPKGQAQMEQSAPNTEGGKPSAKNTLAAVAEVAGQGAPRAPMRVGQ